MLIDSESGMMSIPGGEGTASATAPTPGPTPLSARQVAAGERILALIRGATEGSLPLERELRGMEPQKLNATHVNMCIDRSLGFTPSEIAAKYEYAPTYVSTILLHPYSQLLISTIMSAAADKVQDVETRLKALAPEALNVQVDILRSSKSDNLRNKIASELLDRAGYGSRKKVDANLVATFVVPAALAESLGTVLDESKQIASLDYSRFTSSSIESNSPGRDSALPQHAEHMLPAVVPPAAESREESAEARALREEKDWADESKRLKIA